MECSRARFVFDNCQDISDREFASMLRHLWSCPKCQAWFKNLIDSLSKEELIRLIDEYASEE